MAKRSASLFCNAHYPALYKSDRLSMSPNRAHCYHRSWTLSNHCYPSYIRECTRCLCDFHRLLCLASIASPNGLVLDVLRHVPRPSPPAFWMDSVSWAVAFFSAHNSIHWLDIRRPMVASQFYRNRGQYFRFRWALAMLSIPVLPYVWALRAMPRSIVAVAIHAIDSCPIWICRQSDVCRWFVYACAFWWSAARVVWCEC